MTIVLALFAAIALFAVVSVAIEQHRRRNWKRTLKDDRGRRYFRDKNGTIRRCVIRRDGSILPVPKRIVRRLRRSRRA